MQLRKNKLQLLWSLKDWASILLGLICCITQIQVKVGRKQLF